MCEQDENMHGWIDKKDAMYQTCQMGRKFQSEVDSKELHLLWGEAQNPAHWRVKKQH